jgi:hypothetical protein
MQTRTGDREVQIKTVEVLATVAADGQVVLQLPPEITPGNHRITLLIEENLTPSHDPRTQSLLQYLQHPES